MPVYLFTFHTYRSWMPDRGRGYGRREEGILPPDEEMAEKYRQRAKDDPTTLTREIQRALLKEMQTASQFQRLRFHAGSTEPSHIHVLTSWRDARTALAVRSGAKKSFSIRLAKLSTPDHQQFLSGGASQKRVRDNAHLTHLLEVYLPKHRGVAWYEDRGWIDQFE